jgi:beta-galactosidase GanA
LQYFSFENRNFTQLAKHHYVYNTAVFENTAVFFQNCRKTLFPNTPLTPALWSGAVIINKDKKYYRNSINWYMNSSFSENISLKVKKEFFFEKKPKFHPNQRLTSCSLRIKTVALDNVYIKTLYIY